GAHGRGHPPGGVRLARAAPGPRLAARRRTARHAPHPARAGLAGGPGRRRRGDRRPRLGHLLRRRTGPPGAARRLRRGRGPARLAHRPAGPRRPRAGPGRPGAPPGPRRGGRARPGPERMVRRAAELGPRPGGPAAAPDHVRDARAGGARRSRGPRPAPAAPPLGPAGRRGAPVRPAGPAPAGDAPVRGTAAAVRVRGVLSFPGPDPAEEPGLVDDHVWVDARGAAAQAGGGRWPAVLGSADVLTLTGRIGCPAAALEHWPGAAARAGAGWAVRAAGRPPVHLPGPLTPWQAAPLLSLLHTWAAAGSAAGGPVPQGSLPPAGTPVLVLPPAGERGRPAFTAQAG